MPDEDFTEAGRLLFARECLFVAGAPTVEALPPMRGPEIAFAGRSNVGKSSLVNALTGRRTLARVSHTPGRTQQLNFFDLGGRLGLVDMPGYGYAAVSKTTIEAWSNLVGRFLAGRASLMRVYLLVDGRHGLKDIDHAQMTAFDRAATSYAVVLTKGDAVKARERDALIEATRAALATHPAAFPEVMLTSAETGAGVPELRAGIARLLAERTSSTPATQGIGS
ncbi:MAG TPA: ribosome biogenesis GTP-binding protein YihA/YsxC [Lichenihabitans sp.]|jgi:GTP-binding protein|nr:ribosome biogenesis GTP-binding protein YihA/YsxC [Lichenihabitans sp.]